MPRLRCRSYLLLIGPVSITLQTPPHLQKPHKRVTSSDIHVSSYRLTTDTCNSWTDSRRWVLTYARPVRPSRLKYVPLHVLSHTSRTIKPSLPLSLTESLIHDSFLNQKSSVRSAIISFMRKRVKDLEIYFLFCISSSSFGS